MKFISAFRVGAGLKDSGYTEKLLKSLHKRLPRKKLPFRVFFDCEGSSADRLCFRVEHVAGTSAKVYVVSPENKKRWRRSRYEFVVDATDGSNWHHKRYEFVQWFRIVLAEVDVPSNIELVIA